MKTPYNRVHVCGDVVFAARAGKLHSFSLRDGNHIATWQHPDVSKVAEATKAAEEVKPDEDVSLVDPATAQEASGDEPPAKRLKVADGAPAANTESSAIPDAANESGAASGPAEGKTKGKKSKKKQGEPRVQPAVPDRPVITHLASTADGSHIVAVTGHDKCIWVFTHDGAGNLTQFSSRAMPKRPSAITVTHDSQILTADKFGDVFSLPLLGTVYSASEASGTPRSSTPQAVVNARSKVAGSTFTVHSKRNLEALINQQKQLELASRSKSEGQDKSEGPNFELTLQLGHVSMLTAVTLAESDGRRYIVTADRDEHIRLSRYMPQAHIIEGFCLGHKEFIGDVIVPLNRPEVLISGGGDEEVFVWDWKAGIATSKKSILALAREIAPETTKVAVSGLFSLVYPTESENVTYILAICEGIKAIFSWQLTPENNLNHPSIIQLPGNPLHLAVAKAENGQPSIIAAVDPGEGVKAKSLHVFKLTQAEGRIAVDTDSTVRDDTLEAEEPEVPENVVRNLLYTTEGLRKQPADADADANDAAEGDQEAAPEQE